MFFSGTINRCNVYPKSTAGKVKLAQVMTRCELTHADNNFEMLWCTKK